MFSQRCSCIVPLSRHSVFGFRRFEPTCRPEDDPAGGGRGCGAHCSGRRRVYWTVTDRPFYYCTKTENINMLPRWAAATRHSPRCCACTSMAFLVDVISWSVDNSVLIVKVKMSKVSQHLRAASADNLQELLPYPWAQQFYRTRSRYPPRIQTTSIVLRWVLK